jgi:hypothetical protein
MSGYADTSISEPDDKQPALVLAYTSTSYGCMENRINQINGIDSFGFYIISGAIAIS